MTKENREYAQEMTTNILCRIFECRDAERITESILPKVVKDIEETADEDFNDCDIEIAVQRVLLKRMRLSE